MRLILLFSLLLAVAAPAQAAALTIAVVEEPGQPAGTTDVVVAGLVPGVVVTIATEPPPDAPVEVSDGMCTPDGGALRCMPDADMLRVRLQKPLWRVVATQDDARAEWPQRAPVVWPETTIAWDGRLLTIAATGRGGLGLILIPADGSLATAAGDGTPNSVCRLVTWLRDFGRTEHWVACGIQLDDGGAGAVTIRIPADVTMLDLVEEVGGEQRRTTWLVPERTPVRSRQYLPVVLP